MNAKKRSKMQSKSKSRQDPSRVIVDSRTAVAALDLGCFARQFGSDMLKESVPQLFGHVQTDAVVSLIVQMNHLDSLYKQMDEAGQQCRMTGNLEFEITELAMPFLSAIADRVILHTSPYFVHYQVGAALGGLIAREKSCQGTVSKLDRSDFVPLLTACSKLRSQPLGTIPTLDGFAGRMEAKECIEAADLLKVAAVPDGSPQHRQFGNLKLATWQFFSSIRGEISQLRNWTTVQLDSRTEERDQFIYNECVKQTAHCKIRIIVNAHPGWGKLSTDTAVKAVASRFAKRRGLAEPPPRTRGRRPKA